MHRKLQGDGSPSVDLRQMLFVEWEKRREGKYFDVDRRISHCKLWEGPLNAESPVCCQNIRNMLVMKYFIAMQDIL